MKQFFFALLLAATCIFSASDVQAQANRSGPSQANQVLTLVQQGKFEEARALLRSFEAGKFDILFLEAQIQRAEGKPDEAVKTLRSILADEPGLILARRTLAQTLIDMRDFEAAEFHLKILNRSDPSPTARGSYRQALARISRARPYGVSASFSLVPSSNINRGTYNEEFENEAGQVGTITSQAESGIGAQLGLSGYVTTQVSERGSLTFSANGFYTKYSKSEFDSSQIGTALKYAVNLGQTSWEFGPNYRRNFEADEYSRSTYGFGISHRRLLDPRTRLTFGLNAERVKYDEVDNLTGPNLSASFTMERQISPSLSLLGGFNLGRSKPEGDNFKHYSAGVRGGISKTWKGGFATYVEMQLGARKYDAPFTVGREERSDQYLSISANVLNSKLSVQGFAPRLGCSLLFNRSNIEFYDYNVQECRLSITRGF